ncbi:ADP-ribosylglycohydrolase family protein [Chitinophaga qingshengii]|uniref:ADP-ribosylglycohydrolase family protein n=1 Tax=Chitinophaga qingshengii TaxID=1569794 RepID=A0ABR7TTU2_9BACT|nr:ADP-ribosylglycohydrolase family protein [Chitinophaga qingshengii]
MRDKCGDTDTNAAIAGQIAGALLGRTGLPVSLLQQLEALLEYPWLQQVITDTGKVLFDR